MLYITQITNQLSHSNMSNPLQSKNMKKKCRYGMRVVSAIARTSWFKKELNDTVINKGIESHRKKYKKMITTDLPEKFQRPWRKKYRNIVNEKVKVWGWRGSWSGITLVSTSRERFRALYKEKIGGYLFRTDRYKTILTQNKIYRKKKTLKHVNPSFSNEDFMAYKNLYVQHKLNEKDEQIKMLKLHIASIRREVKYGIGATYQAQAKSGKFADRFRELLELVD